MADPRLRTLKIKTGVVKRLTKEKVVYEKEADAQVLRIEKYKREGRDEYDVRKQEEVLQESLMMVPDCQRRLLKACEDLKQILSTELDLKEKEEFIAAEKILEEAKLQLPKPDLQTSFYNYNVVKYQPPFQIADPRLNFVNKTPICVNEQVLQPYLSQNEIKYDFTLQSHESEIEQKTDDDLYIETWLSKIGKIQINLDSTVEIIPMQKKSIKKASSLVKLSSVKQSLRRCLIIINKLENIQDELKKNVETLSSAEWKKKTVDIGSLKDELTSLSSQFGYGHVLTQIQKSIVMRKKKRLNQKKARITRKIEVAEIKKNNKKISNDIDQWLENMKDKVEKAKTEERMQKDADCILAEVTLKKADARKQLSLISALIKLRNIRENMAVQRAQTISLEDRSAFNKLTEKLTNMWEDMTKVYLKEEQCLKLMLESSIEKDSNLQTAKYEKIIEQWDYSLFGPKCIPSHTYWGLTAADKSIENFIAIRKSWDTFLVDENDECGSKIPIGWCLPSVNASASWTKYLQNIF